MLSARPPRAAPASGRTDQRPRAPSHTPQRTPTRTKTRRFSKSETQVQAPEGTPGGDVGAASSSVFSETKGAVPPGQTWSPHPHRGWNSGNCLPQGRSRPRPPLGVTVAACVWGAPGRASSRPPRAGRLSERRAAVALGRPRVFICPRRLTLILPKSLTRQENSAASEAELTASRAPHLRAEDCDVTAGAGEARRGPRPRGGAGGAGGRRLEPGQQGPQEPQTRGHRVTPVGRSPGDTPMSAWGTALDFRGPEQQDDDLCRSSL